MTTPRNPDTELGTLPSEKGFDWEQRWECHDTGDTGMVPLSDGRVVVYRVYGDAERATRAALSSIAENPPRFIDPIALAPGSALPNPDPPRCDECGGRLAPVRIPWLNEEQEASVRLGALYCDHGHAIRHFREDGHLTAVGRTRVPNPDQPRTKIPHSEHRHDSHDWRADVCQVCGTKDWSAVATVPCVGYNPNSADDSAVSSSGSPTNEGEG